MTYATLVFGRTKFPVVKVSENGAERELASEEAEEYFNRVIEAPWKAYDKELQDARSRRVAFKERCVVKTFEQAMAEWDRAPRRFGVMKGTPPEPFDQVTIDGQVCEAPAGAAEKFIDEQASKRHPDPQQPGDDRPRFGRWFAANSKEKRTWQAELVTSAGATPVELGDLGWKYGGYPAFAAVQALDKLEQQGWKLAHVSEDHGLYTGADAADEAYLARVRYLLSRA